MSNKIEKSFGISTWAINNKMTVYVITAILLFGGLITYYSMPRESFPEIIETKIYVSSINPGNSAVDVEKLITKPLEEEFNNISGVTEITSNTLEDYSMILVEFDEDISVQDAKQKVKDEVDKVKADTEWPTTDGGAKVEPNIFDLNIAEETPILNINLTGDFTSEKLKEYAEYLEDRIERLPQIKEAAIRGAEEKEVEIAVDMYKMAAAMVSFDDIINAIKFENKTVSGGNVTRNGINKNIRVIGEIDEPSQLENIIVKKQDGNVYLKDIATITFKEKERTTYAREYGEPVVMLDIKKRSGKNMVEAVDGVRAIIAKAQDDYFPKGLKITYANDQSSRTIAQVDDLVNNIIFGVLLVVIVLMFFLGLRNALFVGIAIPLSMFMSYMILGAMGITLNTMVLFALVMGLGMLVDNGIVVVENVYSLMSQGMSRKQAAIEGIGEIAWPIIASTATTLAAFFPLGLWPGTMGKFMIYFPMTLSIVLGSSLFVALVINAMLTADFMKLKENEMSRKKMVRLSLIIGGIGLIALIGGISTGSGALKGMGNLMLFFVIMLWVYKFFLVKRMERFQNNGLVWLENKYRDFLQYALGGIKPRLFFIGTFALLILSFFAVGMREPKTLFFPENEPNQIMVYIEFPEGTDIDKTNAFTKIIEEKVYAVAHKYIEDGENYMIESAIAQVGQGAGNPQTDSGSESEMPHRGKVTLTMREFKYRKGVKSTSVMEEIRKAVQGYAGVSVVVEKDAAGPPAGYPVNIEIKGEDYDEMLAQAYKLRDFINEKNIPGIEELKIDVNKQKPGVDVTVDINKAGELGITSGKVGETLRRAIYGEKASTYKEGKDDYEINVRLEEEQRNNNSILYNQPVTFRDQATGQLVQVPISAITTSENTVTFNMIKRKNLKRVITVYSNVVSGYNGNEIVEKIKSELTNYKMPGEINYAFTGEQEEQSKNMGFLVKALLIALGGIVLILVAQFNSVSKPVIIMVSVLLSFGGVFWGMAISGDDFVIIMTMMGIISLAGIVVNNAIVLIDYTQLLIDRKLAEKGLEDKALLTKEEYRELIVEGGRSRLRPVLLTAITTILGLIPLAIGLNIDFFSLFIEYNPKIYLGGDNVIFWGPLAKTVIYGLIFATFLTLVIVPVMFFMLQKIKIRLKKNPDNVTT
ncbi:efflux RND transporter permease subunit [Flavobacterium salilacus subsp. salilacus]|uniref:efflux RND transporter permease subunit n=1 Tax=Flavobacterium TaxID=237 RepID=UPI001075049D|nr:MULTISPECIES: efflux RND transporter permease subunit [Flavobacterium]KAF2520162.1 efflux RND transporter permease subunit [Flavobacterium salilacus subsp. salilacus]MBE1613922.1 efflux RND transporter permease subunit [Flavobacterium sp. SaA2.13]